MEIELLDLAAASDAGLDLPDVYYSPSYGASAEVIDGGTWECAVAEGGRHVFPYLRREVPAGTGEWDLVSPYGYAGVVAPDDVSRAAFVTSFRQTARERGLVAEFLRTNPFDVTDPRTAGLGVDSWRAHPTFVVALGTGDSAVEDYWDGCEGRHRTAVRKAGKSGVVVGQVPAEQLTDAGSGFRVMYDETMDRVGSSGRLRMPDAYYEQLVEGLGDGVVLLQAVQDGEPVAASIFMVWDDRVHYHLSGSTPDGMRNGATNALLDHAVRTLIPPGGRLHLGGGVSEGDGLEKFKRSLSTEQTTVFLCRTVVDRGRYDELVAASSAPAETNYFPAYRG